MEYVGFGEEHLDGVLRLTQQEGWPSFAADPARALMALTAPGAVTVVALDDDEVVGFARALSDGVIVSYLADMAVAPAYRRHGVGRRLVEEVFRRGGAIRMDVLSTDEARGFYESFTHRSWPGYRLYPIVDADAEWR